MRRLQQWRVLRRLSVRVAVASNCAISAVRAFERCRDVCQSVQNFVLSIARNDFQSTSIALSLLNDVPNAKHTRSTHDTVCHTRSNAHEHPILTHRSQRMTHETTTTCASAFQRARSDCRLAHCAASTAAIEISKHRWPLHAA